MILETKYRWNATKISILQQKFENFCKIPSWCLYLWFKSFYFVIVNSTFDTAFCDKFIDWQQHFFYLMKVFIVLIPWVKAWHIHSASIISLNKLRNDKASHIDNFTNKLDNSDNTNMLWVFLTHFHFKSVLSSNTHSWLANMYYS